MELPLKRIPVEWLNAYARARSAVFAAESLIGPAIELAVRRRRRRPRLLTDDRELFAASRSSLERLLREDVERIAAGIYPVDVLWPESPLSHLRRMPEMFAEGLALSRRRKEKRSKEFGPDAQEFLRDVPDYYRRNFHFQPDGYLSEKSARLYEHQVEVLFAGGADAMRRLVIEPMKRAFGGSDGEGLCFLEIGAGTGRATRFVRQAFPRARIVALDVSAPYLKEARRRLAEFSRVDFAQAAGEALPFQDGLFDAVYSVFLFHELPLEARRKVLEESKRALKPGGFLGWVDSLQLGDRPEFDGALLNFPGEFHEPFYRNYLERPMEALAAEAGFENVEASSGFLSKAGGASKPSPEAKAASRARGGSPRTRARRPSNRNAADA